MSADNWYWAATAIIGETSTGAIGYSGPAVTGSLTSPPKFTVGGTEYEINSILLGSTATLTVVLRSAISTDFVLRIGTTALNKSDATDVIPGTYS